jgi:lysyl-tRNA synthetase class 1
MQQYWADQMIGEIDAPEIIINDSKTLSGAAHVGSLRGPVIHDILYRAALDAGRSVKFWYGSDDYDAFDRTPPVLSREIYDPYLGKPLCAVPAPDGSSRSYAEYYADEFLGVMRILGVTPQTYRMSELYRTGRMNDVIRIALDQTPLVREIYLETSGSERNETWFPFSPICENCGKIATTRVYKWDGDRVLYRCSDIDYTQGCGHEGAVSPFDGHGKLPWKLEWASRWSVLNVNVEGAGMDHSVAGGSRDVAEAIARQVYHREPPANVPYEFFLLEGGKMSSSKGIGYSAREVSEILPPELLRFILVRTRPRTAIDFKLADAAIPRLFDEYDAAAEKYFEETSDDEALWTKRLFELAQLVRDVHLVPTYRPRFLHVVTVSQIPGIDTRRHFEVHKGAALTAEEFAEVQRRIDYAHLWLERFAPDDAVIEVQPNLPSTARHLDADQRQFVARLLDWLKTADELSGEQIHKGIYDIATNMGIKPGKAFQTVYLLMLGRTSGPRAGDLLAALERSFVVKRLQQADAIQYLESAPFRVIEKRRDAHYGDVLTIHGDVFDQFPELRIGVAVIRGVRNRESHPELELLKAKTAQDLAEKYGTTNLGSLNRIKAYREIYRAFGADPGSRNPSAEALLRRAVKKSFPKISAVVDSYNVSSAESIIPMAAYDLATLTLPVDLRFAQSGEVLHPISGGDPVSINAGELVYADQTQVICLDFNYRDADATKITLDTTDVLLLIDGCADTPVDEIQDMLDLAVSRIVRYAGGTLDIAAVLYRDL